MKITKKFGMGCLIFAASVFSAPSALCTGGEDKGLFKTVYENTNPEDVMKLCGCLLQLPAILTADSDESPDIKIATGLAMLGVDGKVLYELFKNRYATSLFKDFTYHGSKMMLYSAANFYDYLRLKYPAPVLKDNEQAKKMLQKGKIIGLALFIIEVMLRGGALFLNWHVNHLRHGRDEMEDRETMTLANQSNLNEWADVIEIARLLTRFYMLKAQLPADVNKKLEQDLAEAKTKLAGVFRKPRQA